LSADFFSANNVTIDAFTDAFNATNIATTGVYYAVPRSGEFSGNPPYSVSRQYFETRIMIPGVGEVGTKRIYPFGIKGIYADIIFVGTKAQCETLRENTMSTFEQLKRYSIKMPDGPTFQGCKLDSVRKLRQVQMAGGNIAMICACQWTQLGPTN